MSIRFMYMKLQWKRACKNLPYFLVGAIVLAALLGTIAFSASKVLYGETAIGRITVGIVLPEDDKIAEKALAMLSSMESVKSICDFVYPGEEEGIKLLKKGELYALMLVPEGFVRDIIRGVNTPVTVVLPENPGMETMVLKELTDAGARTLSVAQAGIYGAGEFCQVYGLVDSIPEVEAALNRLYMKYALPREDYFRHYQVSAVGDVTMIEYYGISAMVLLLLLCGIPASSIVKPERQVIGQKLKLAGVGRGTMVMARILSVAFLLLLVLGMGYGIFLGMGILKFHWGHPWLMFMICMSASSMIVFAYEVAGSQMAGVMLVFLASVAMMFLAGGFIPAVFLPEGFVKLSAFLPASWLIEGMKGFLSEGTSMMVTGKLGMAVAGFYGASVIVRRQV